MRDPDATVPTPKPTPTPPSGGGGMTDSAVGALFDAAAPAFATQQRTTGSRGWEPPSVEVLQKALPQYEITQFIACGGMGAVYKGLQKTLKRAVAIKVLPPDIDDGELQYAERFKREAQAMARLSHPNIVAVHDAGEVVLRKQGAGSGEQGGREGAMGRALDPSSAAARSDGLDADKDDPGGAGTSRRLRDQPPYQDARDAEGTPGRALDPSSAAARSDGLDADQDDAGGAGNSRRLRDQPPYRDASGQGTLLYFVMEYVEGTDVAQLIAREGRLPPERAVPIIMAVCDALAFAHEEGIIHRDIKPSNVMIDQRGRVKVADFGLAKTINVESTMLTRSDVAMGTPDFVAPEALIAGTAVDGRADLYAVGVMLYQMLTGHIPRGRFALPSGVIPQVDARFDAIVDKAMQPDRERRYTTAAEMRKEVESVTTAPVAALPAPPNAVPAKKGRNRLLPALGAAAVLGAAGWLVLEKKQPEGTPASSTTDFAALPPAIEARGIKLWDAPERVAGGAKGIRWKDDALHLEHASRSSGPENRDAILRARIKNGGNVALVLALRKRDDGVHCRLEVNLALRTLVLRTDTAGPLLGEWELPRAYKPDEWVPVELRTLGDKFTVLVSGQFVASVRSREASREGKALIYSGIGGGYFRDITYYPLDGLPEAEALKAAGISSSAPQWRDALAEGQLKSVVAKVTRSLTGYVLPPKSNWVFPSEGLQAGAIRWRGVVRNGWPELTLKESDQHQFLLGISRSTRRPYIAEKNGSQVKNLADGEEYAGFQPKDGEVSELVVTRVGGKLGLLINGRLACEATIQQAGRMQFAIVLHEDPVPTIQSLEYISLNGLPEAEALKLAGLDAQSQSTASAAPYPQVDASGSPIYTPGIWTRMWSADEEAQNVARKDGDWVLLNQVSRGCSGSFTNAGMRVRFRNQLVTDHFHPQFNLRAPNVGAMNLHLNPEGTELQIRDARDRGALPVLASLRLPQPVPPGTEYQMEFYAVGQKLIGRVNGQTVTATITGDTSPGPLSLYMANADYIRDLEVLNLDGLPETEALKLVGAEKAASATGSTKPPQWLDVTEEIRTTGLRDGALKADGTNLAAIQKKGFTLAGGRSFADAAVRISFSGSLSIKLRQSDSTAAYSAYVPAGSAPKEFVAGRLNYTAPRQEVNEPLSDWGKAAARGGDGMQEIIFAVQGNKLTLALNGQIVSTASDARLASGRAELTVMPDGDKSSTALGKVQIVDLAGLSEAEALKLAGAEAKSAYRFPDGPPGFVKELNGHTGEVRRMEILPDNRRIISIAGKDAADNDVNELVLWDVEAAQPFWSRQLKEINGVLGGMAVLSAVNQVVVIHRGPEHVMEFLDLDKGTTVRQVKVEKPQEGSFGTQLVAAPDGRRFMLLLFPAKAGTSDPLLFQLWDASGEKPMNTWQAPGRSDSWHTSAWLDAGRFVTSTQDLAGKGKVVLLLEMTGAGGVRQILENDRDAGLFFNTVPGEPDQILTNWQGSDLAVYDVKKSTMHRKFGVPRVQRQLVFVDSERVLGLSTEYGDALRIWDAKGGKLQWEQRDERLCDAVAVSPDGRFAVTNSSTKNPGGQNRPGTKLLVWRLPKAEAGSQPSGTTFNGHRYQVVKEPGISWPQAKAKAEAMGGHLATLTSKEEADFVHGLCAKTLPTKPFQAWLGGSRDRGKDAPWQWVTGEAFSYQGAWDSDHAEAEKRGQPAYLTVERRDGVVEDLREWNNFSQTDSPAFLAHIGGYVVEWE